MAVRLQLENGDTHHYRTWYSRTEGEIGPTTYHTECGMFWEQKPPSDGGCEHIECAIKAAEFEANFFIAGICVLALMFLIIFIFQMVEEGVTASFVIYAALLILPIGLSFRGFDKGHRELVEFRDHGTVNGIRAEQIWRPPPPPRPSPSSTDPLVRPPGADAPDGAVPGAARGRRPPPHTRHHQRPSRRRSRKARLDDGDLRLR